MRLKRLELYGFKSFAQKTVLHFDQPISVIVGPNGSGKSNIADAVRWVLGEQSAKSLRGGKMADVIFSGTDQKKPLNMTQVTMVLDNRDQRLPVAYDEVVVSRKLFRSGETEYALNRTGCRLKDIRSLFMDTGIGKEGYSIIGQGKIDEIISTRDQDRRELFEEATGISKYRYQIDEARSKLEKTRENLLRVEDILVQLKEQLKYLTKEAEKARRGMHFTREHEKHTLAYYAKEMKLAQTQIRALIEEKEQLQADMAAANERRDHIQRRMRPLLLETDARAQEQMALEEQNAIVGKNREAAERDLQLSLQKAEFLQRDAKRLEKEQASAEKELSRIQERLQGLIKEEENLVRRLAEEETQQADSERKLQELQSATETLHRQLQARRNELRENERIWRDLQVKLHAKENAVQMREEQVATLKSTFVAQQERKNSLLNEQAHLQAKAKRAEARYETLVRSLRDYDSHIQTIDELLAKEEKVLREQKTLLETKERRLQAIEHMIRNHEGYHRSVQQFLRAAQQNPYLRPRFIGALGTLLQVDQTLRVPIEVALGAALHNIVTREAVQAKELIEWLKENRVGRITFLPADQVKGTPYNGHWPTVQEGGIGPALQYVTGPEEIQTILVSLLGRTCLIEDMDAGIRLRKNRNYDRLRFVTRAGELIFPGGSMVGGYLQKEGGLLSRESDREVLLEEIPPIETAIQEYEKRMVSLQEEKQNRIAKREEQRKTGRELYEERQLAGERLAAKSAQIEVFQKSLEETETALNEADTDQSMESIRAELLAQKEKWSADENRLQEEETCFLQQEESLREAERKHGVIRSLAEGHQRDVSLIRNRLADTNEQKAARDEEKQDAVVALEEIRQAMETEKRKQERLRKQMAEGKRKEEELDLQKAKLKEESNRLEQQLAACRLEQEEAQEHFRKLEKEQATHGLRLANAREKLHRLLETVAMELNIDEEKAWEKLKSAPEIKTSRGKVREIKEALRAVGSFSFESIEEHKAVRERHAFLSAQSEDLRRSGEDLREVIRKLEITMRKQFTEGISLINEKFAQVFKTLFDGGQAEVALTGEDVLEAGVQIIARPPGKTRQAISLLSGGEKALTAVALLFAIFETRPSPFCVLDEIDAALDDANIARYKQYLESFRGRIQFVIITHRKQTMELADMIYGVTMQENATSRIIPLELAKKKNAESA